MAHLALPVPLTVSNAIPPLIVLDVYLATMQPPMLQVKNNVSLNGGNGFLSFLGFFWVSFSLVRVGRFRIAYLLAKEEVKLGG